MIDTEESNARIELGRTIIIPHTFYIGFLGLRLGGESPGFSHSYRAYAEDFEGVIALTGFNVEPEKVFDYMQVCERFAKSVGREMKRHGVTAYEFKSGSMDTGIVFWEPFGQFAYLRTAGAKMDPIPERGIEHFKKTLEECLQE